MVQDNVIIIKQFTKNDASVFLDRGGFYEKVAKQSAICNCF